MLLFHININKLYYFNMIQMMWNMTACFSRLAKYSNIYNYRQKFCIIGILVKFVHIIYRFYFWHALKILAKNFIELELLVLSFSSTNYWTSPRHTIQDYMLLIGSPYKGGRETYHLKNVWERGGGRERDRDATLPYKSILLHHGLQQCTSIFLLHGPRILQFNYAQ